MQKLILPLLILTAPLLSEEKSNFKITEEESSSEETCTSCEEQADGYMEVNEGVYKLSLPDGYSSRKCRRHPRCGDVDENWYDDDDASWPTQKEEAWLDEVFDSNTKYYR